MSFVIDKQTLDDLNLLGKYKNKSIFSLFSETQTIGGERAMELMFHNPLCDANEINRRAEIFSYFGTNNIPFSFDLDRLKDVELYLSSIGNSNRMISWAITYRRKLMRAISNDPAYELLINGILSTINLINELHAFIKQISEIKDSESSPYFSIIDQLKLLLASKQLRWAIGISPKTLNSMSVAHYDYKLRSEGAKLLSDILDIVYHIDLYSTVATVAKEHKLTKAVAHITTVETNSIEIKDLFHPQIKGAVANDITIDYGHNVLFLTGANMAGKSTFMKSFGIAIYLAHMGFPVPAQTMNFSVQEGIYTSINVSDNLSLGYSHFYAEVIRVKNVALEVAQGKRLVVIFDELFKGTNVKDAYDATVASIEAFSENRQSLYIVSTHILEAGIELKKRHDNFHFLYFPTIMQGLIPKYTFKLAEGISADRHGMMIIRNERIIEIIKGKG